MVTCVCLTDPAVIAVARVEVPSSSTRLPAPEHNTTQTAAIAAARPPKSIDTRASTNANATPVPSPAASAEIAPAVMPDFKGKRLSAVRHQAKRLGFRVAARDDLGQRLLIDDGYLYRVRRQNVAAGEPVPAAGTVEVTVREVGDSLGGY